jgi:hypothetical protein
MYDEQLGRWHSVDGLSEVQTNESSYAYVSNCPTSFSDVGGAFKMPAQMRMTYPHLYELLENIAPDIVFNFVAMARLQQFSGLSATQIRQDVQIGSGPEIQAPVGWGSSMGNFNEPDARLGESGGRGILNLNPSMLAKLEQLARQGNAEEARILSFLVLVTIFHEYIHNGRAASGLPKGISNPSLPNTFTEPNDAGANWENALLGNVIGRDMDSEESPQTSARHYLKNHPSSNYTAGSMIEVTRGLVPSSSPTPSPKPSHKKPEHPRPLKYIKPGKEHRSDR